MANRYDFLDKVTNQISYKPLRPAIRQELEEHILDRIEEYAAEGFSPDEAERKAVKAMGDPTAIGAELNSVHQVQKAPALTLITLLLLLLGFCTAVYLWRTPESYANGCFYYLPGLAVLLLLSWKGYGLVLRHARLMLILTGILTAIQPVLFFGARYGQIYFGGTHILGYFTLLLLGPACTLLLYRFRCYGAKAIAAVLVLCGIIIAGFSRFFLSVFGLTASAILLCTMTGTLAFMIHRDLLGDSLSVKRTLYGITLAGLIFIGGFFFSSSYKRDLLGEFIRPEAYAADVWTDAYNSVLIQKLLSRTPLIRGLALSPEEMMNYGTGDWYFTPQNPAGDSLPKYIHYDESNVTLWDILPQHYHNNYLIALCIFLYGWLPGLAMISIMTSFYLMLFSCIRKIHGGLASSLAFCSGLCLLFQGIFYLSGNLGHQYAAFPNLPLLSEGRISIIFNMALLGFIFSAYRYDKVIAEPEECIRCRAHEGLL